MPHTRIEIEEVEHGRWVAEVEVGGMMARRKRVTAEDAPGIIIAACGALAEFTPDSEMAQQLAAVMRKLAPAAPTQRAAEAISVAPTKRKRMKGGENDPPEDAA